MATHGGGGGTYRIPTKGPVTPKEIYYLLLNQGYSTPQAIGIMANMQAESSFDPEASNGTHVGLVQWETSGFKTAGLITGNPQKDVRSQIRYITQTIPKNALRASTPQDIAGNISAQFEKCQGCEPGGASWTARRGFAATLAAAAKTGRWQQTAGGTQSGGNQPGGAPASAGAAQTNACILSTPNVLFLSGGCIFSKTNARALIGGLMLVGGGGTMLVGLAVLVAGAFAGTKAGQAAGRVAGSVTEGAGAVAAAAGAPEVGAPIAAMGSAAKGRSGRAGRYAKGKAETKRKAKASKRREQDSTDRRTEKAYNQRRRSIDREDLNTAEDKPPY